MIAGNFAAKHIKHCIAITVHAATIVFVATGICAMRNNAGFLTIAKVKTCSIEQADCSVFCISLTDNAVSIQAKIDSFIVYYAKFSV